MFGEKKMLKCHLGTLAFKAIHWNESFSAKEAKLHLKRKYRSMQLVFEHIFAKFRLKTTLNCQ